MEEDHLTGPGTRATVTTLDEITQRIQALLGGRPAVCAYASESGKLRFSGRPARGKRPPNAPLDDFPTLATAMSESRPEFLTEGEAARFGVEQAAAIPFASGEVEGVCVLLGVEALSLTPTALAGISSGVAAMLDLLRERDDLRRRAAELEQSVSGFRALMERTSDAVKIIDLDGRIRAWNAGCETLYGFKPREVIGQVLPHLDAAARPRAIADFRRIASLGAMEEREIVSRRKDGSVVGVRTTAVPLRDAEGLPVGVLTIAQSVESDSRLEQMQGDFLSLVSQELRNPITAVLGFTQLLGRPEIAEDGAKRSRTVRALESRAQQLAAVVDDLMLASRIERGDLRLRREPTDLATLVTETVTRFEQFQPKHRFLIDVDTRIPPADVDPRRIEQALTNLLSNAVRYSPDAEEVRITVVRDGDEATLSVTDKGAGIPKKDLERVFDRFYKGEASRGESGAGLGLFLVRTIAEGHGGSVSVSSEHGKGSTFTMRLPLVG